MASVQSSPSAPINVNLSIAEKRSSSDSDDPENIPYHARENALPFTYGNLPAGFSTSELNHIAVDVPDLSKPSTPPTNAYTASPLTQRKSTRPSISPSRPVLRKTPSREEFNEMLMERKAQALRSQNNLAKKQEQNAAIQKDLDELQQRLTRTVLHGNKNKTDSVKENPLPRSKEVITQIESIHLPEASPSNALVSHEPALLLVEQKRSETPTFPVAIRSGNSERCTSPYPAQRTQQAIIFDDQVISDESNKNQRQDTLPQQIDGNSHTQEVEPHLVKFAKDSSKFWYKPHIAREEAVDLLRNAVPGTFLIRNSTTYKDSYGLVLRVAKPPAGEVVSAKKDELVRHFLLEPTTRGVHLKGCTNEPIFSSLSAFVYQHSINQLALPYTLTLPDHDLLLSSNDEELITRQKKLLQQGAACNVLYLFQCDMESLTGDEAVRKAISEMYQTPDRLPPVEVHFKVSQEGITLTDNTRKRFFRRHYAAQNISHFNMDPDQHTWGVPAINEGLEVSVNKSIFAFIARPLTGSKDNQCHIFCDLAVTQPACAIVCFANKVLPLSKSNYL